MSPKRLWLPLLSAGALGATERKFWQLSDRCSGVVVGDCASGAEDLKLYGLLACAAENEKSCEVVSENVLRVGCGSECASGD